MKSLKPSLEGRVQFEASDAYCLQNFEVLLVALVFALQLKWRIHLCTLENSVNGTELTSISIVGDNVTRFTTVFDSLQARMEANREEMGKRESEKLARVLSRFQ
jgi:hypothetical protein